MDSGFDTHLFTYRHDGGSWVLEIKARDAEDARLRLGKLAYATYDGVLIARMPAECGLIAKVMCVINRAVRNLYHAVYAIRESEFPAVHESKGG